MPPRIRPDDQRLLAAYEEAALRLVRLLESGQSRSRVLSMIDQLLAELDELTAAYIQTTLPLHFKNGSQEAVNLLRRVRGFRIDEEFTQVHREALQALADSATLNFGGALQTTRLEARKRLTALEKEKIVQDVIAGELTGGASSKSVKESLEAQGITSLRSGNRTWTLEHYASMLTHSLLAEAHNTGAATRYATNGVEYVQIIEREDAPDVCCRFMRNKIVKLGDRRLLNPYHPNCFGAFRPYFGDPSGAIESIDDPRIPAEARKMMLRS